MSSATNESVLGTGVRTARTRGELARGLAALRAGDGADAPSVALVPTMGALHDGHRALIARARELADVVVVSIFVNPLQFGAGEDLDRYPRTLDADLAICAAEGVSLVFTPTTDVVYPDEPQVVVHAGPAGDVLEGVHRPGHFDGVLTVVAKLFNLVRPDVAIFGEKDAQQLLLVRRMVADLDFPVHVVGVPTVREADGLARSSRNRYRSADERARARALPAALQAGADVAGSGPTAVLAAARAVLDDAPGVELDYLELVDATTLEPVVAGTAQGPPATTAVLLAAARVGSTRLIDNVSLVLAPEGR